MPFAALLDSRASEVERSRREDDAEATRRVRLVTICRQLTRLEMKRVFKNKQMLHDIHAMVLHISPSYINPDDSDSLEGLEKLTGGLQTSLSTT